MGNYASKLLFHTNENQKESTIEQAVKQQMATDSSMCTPTLSDKRVLCDPRSASAGISRTPIEKITTQDNSICTPTLSDKRMLCDPRSISAEIARTPIEVKCSPESTLIKRAPTAIPKYLQKKKYLETDMDIVMPPLSPKKHFVPKLIDSDERSDSDRAEAYFTPNVNVIRGEKTITPIDKERYIILGLDPRSPAADFNRTPILMPKSLALIKARSQEMLNRKGSYESDIYNPMNLSRGICTPQKSLSIPKIQLSLDTDSETLKLLDMEQQNKSDILCASQQSDSDSSVFESEEEVTVIKNPKCKNEMEESLISDEQIVTINKEKNKDNIDKDSCKDIEHDIKEMYIKDDNKIEVNDSSEENKTGKKEENIVEKLRKKGPREDIIIMFDECATISTSPKPIKIEEDDQNGKIVGKKKSTKIHAKVTPNEKKIFTPENKILKNRTPFANRSNNDQVQRINSPQYFSRNKIVSETEQENTLPCKIRNAKTKNGHNWDPNTTVFI